ncbi:hypothetical protein MAR_035533 [Mya arenaria]|uniref:Uncharacterized protein n=1 Tax=Mya arenaria TaxID=6604 RepID=A0ABY7EN50_MYAAR|nr:hypothetical protein MAR_035533 [Mya arenaria]
MLVTSSRQAVITGSGFCENVRTPASKETILSGAPEPEVRVRLLLDADRGDLVAQTSAIIAALDAGIGRLEKFKKDVDVVVDRLEDMKDDVGGHRQDLQRTSDTLGEIERQLVNAYDLRTCQQCYADVDLEKARFQRKERKIVQVPSRLNEEVDATMNALQRRLKSIRNGVGSQLSSTKLVRGNSRSFREPAGASSLFPYMDVEHRVTLKRPKDHTRNDGRLAKWPDMTDVRFDQRFHSRRNQMPRLPTLH